jgi:hypothetical protein
VKGAQAQAEDQDGFVAVSGKKACRPVTIHVPAPPRQEEPVVVEQVPVENPESTSTVNDAPMPSKADMRKAKQEEARLKEAEEKRLLELAVADAEKLRASSENKGVSGKQLTPAEFKKQQKLKAKELRRAEDAAVQRIAHQQVSGNLLINQLDALIRQHNREKEILVFLQVDEPAAGIPPFIVVLARVGNLKAKLEFDVDHVTELKNALERNALDYYLNIMDANARADKPVFKYKPFSNPEKLLKQTRACDNQAAQALITSDQEEDDIPLLVEMFEEAASRMPRYPQPYSA